LKNINEHKLISFKSASESFDTEALEEFFDHFTNYRKINNLHREKILFIMDASLTVPRTAPRILHKRKFIHGPTVDKKVKSHIKFDNLFVD